MSVIRIINQEILLKRINKNIDKLNGFGVAAIFFISGNNSTGKTKLAKRILQSCNFYQSVNLGVISKMVRYFKIAKMDRYENCIKAENISIYTDLVVYMAEHYNETGVNAIFEGVQCDTEKLSANPHFLGGVVLKVDKNIAIKRGGRPETHFKREVTVSDYGEVNYFLTSKFLGVENNTHKIEDAFFATLSHLDKLLIDKLFELEQTKSKNNIQLYANQDIFVAKPGAIAT